MLNKQTPIIISSLVDSYRSSGDVLDTGVPRVSFRFFETTIVDTDYYDTYINHAGNNDYLDRVSALTLDGMFVGYSTHFDYTGVLPRFTRPTNTGEPNVLSLNPFNPNYLFGSGVYNTGVMDSGTFNSGVWVSGGHSIRGAHTHNPYTTESSIQSGVHPVTHVFDADFYVRKKTELLNIQSVAHRAPFIMGGWGYDTDGNPVPASGSSLHPNALWDASLWKVGPLDARWDNARGVWQAGGTTKIHLVKVTNIYNPSYFSYEVDRSNSRSQYTRNSPTQKQAFSAGLPIYDPEHVAYHANPDNQGAYELLDYDGVLYPHYEAFIIRSTADTVGQDYYNIWQDDCQDCGHITNQCESGQFPRHESSGNLINGKKILIENPLRQSLDVGDLAFTIKTGRNKKVNTGNFIGGSGINASGNITTDGSGVPVFNVTSAGSDYVHGGFGIVSSGSCLDLLLNFSSGSLVGGVVSPSGGLPHNKTYNVDIYPTNATVETETLDIHWILQAEFKTQQVISHVECEGGIMQTCSIKLQTQGYKTCEWCGTDTGLINSL